MKKVRLLSLFLILVLLVYGCKDDSEEQDPRTPEVDFTFTPSSPVAGEEVKFEAAPLEGSSVIVAWDWSFGDAGGSKEQNPAFVFETAGNHDVTLEVQDETGNTSEVSKSIVVSEAPAMEFPASIAWSYSQGTAVSNPNDGSSSPAIADDGTIYYLESFAGENSKLVAVTDQGENAQGKWAAALGFDLRNAPAIGPEGNIYIAAWSVDPAIKVDAENGNVLWTANTNTGISNSTAAIDSEGNIYLGTRAEGVFCWSPDGNLRWQFPSADGSKTPYYSSPALSKDENTLYILMTGGALLALNTADGSEKWSAPVEVSSGLGSSLSIDSDGTVYLTTDTEVVAVTDEGANGTVKWIANAEGANSSGVVIGPEGILYTGSHTGLLSINPADGSVIWTYEAFVEECVPAVDVNGNVYFGSVDGKLHIVTAAGEKLKEFTLGDNMVHSPTIADDGSVFVEAMDNFEIKLYKITVEDSGPADSPWPMKGQNRKNTGQAI